MGNYLFWDDYKYTYILRHIQVVHPNHLLVFKMLKAFFHIFNHFSLFFFNPTSNIGQTIFHFLEKKVDFLARFLIKLP